MSDPILSAMRTSATGLEAQSFRLRIVAENLANAQSTGKTAGADAYRRKTVSFNEIVDRMTDTVGVAIKRVDRDKSDFRLEFDPGSPAANSAGYVKMPNVNTLVEMADMREANRAYESNLQVVKQAKDMLTMTIDLLRGS